VSYGTDAYGTHCECNRNAVVRGHLRVIKDKLRFVQEQGETD
jgi:hypothetical protein